MPSESSIEEVQPAVSLSPKGQITGIYRARLDLITDPVMQQKDAEHIMAKCWEGENTREVNINLGKVPLDMILHRCNSRCKGGVDYVDGNHVHHYSGVFKSEEVEIVAATVQFLATNVGRGFYRGFLNLLEEANRTNAE